MRYGKTVFNAVGRVYQQTVDAEVNLLSFKYKGELSELELATKLMQNTGYRIEWHHVAENPCLVDEGVVWQADVHPPYGS